MRRQDLQLPFHPSTLASEFDPAIIAMFEHENVGDEPPFDKLITAYGQYRDIYLAYLYGKNDVLPFIRTKGLDAITTDIFLGWLNHAHSLVAASIAKPSNMQAGAFSTAQVRRWHWGMLIDEEIDAYVGGDDTRAITIKKMGLAQEAKPENIDKILSVLRKIRNMEKLAYLNHAGLEYPKEIRPLAIGQTKFVMAYKEKLLSKEDANVLEELVAFGTDPADIPSAMTAFSKSFIKSWRSCDANNPDQLAELLLMAYRGVGGIHPYGNGNGRTATWLMNVVLRSLNKPSILMREQGEKFNSKSSYSEAIKQIDSNPELFKKHVLSRVQKAEFEGHQPCEIECQTVAKKFELYEYLIRMMDKYDNDTRQKLAHTIMSKVEEIIVKKYGYERCLTKEPAIMLSAVELEYELLILLHEGLKAHAKPSTVATPIISNQYSTDEINKIKKILENLSGTDKWKAYTKGTIMLLTLDDELKAKAIIQQLSVIDGIKVTLARTATAERKPVVKVVDINLRKLIKATEPSAITARETRQHSKKY